MVQHRRIFSIFVAVVMPIVTSILPMYGQNYIKKKTYLNESGTEKITDIQYFDGLGRPTLTASNGVGTSGKYVYKSYLRQHRQGLKRIPSRGRLDNCK